MDRLTKIDPATAAAIAKGGLDDAFVKRVDAGGPRSAAKADMVRGLAAANDLVAAIRSAEGRIGAKDFQEVRLSAMLVRQYFEQYGADNNSIGIRDRVMAENANEIMKEGGNAAKAILWAHNGHIQYGSLPYGGQTVGENLRKLIGKDYVAFSLMFNRGRYRAWAVPSATQGGIMSFDSGVAQRGSFASAMATAGSPLAAIDLRSVPTDGPVGRWFTEKRPEWMIGGSRSPSDQSFSFDVEQAVLPEVADIAVFMERTTPSRPLPSVWTPFDIKPAEILPGPANLNLSEGAVGQPPRGWNATAYYGFPYFIPAPIALHGEGRDRFVTINPPANDPDRISVMSQAVDGTPYRGKTVRVTAEVMDDDRSGKPAFGALWIKSDPPNGMANFKVRPIPEGGRGAWQRIAVDLSVPRNATTISFGFRCGGEGNDHVGVRVRDITMGVTSE
jgi:hypothetical protein